MTLVDTRSATEAAADWRTWLGFLAMTVGVFIAILDVQIVASSLAQIQAGLSASTDEIAWIQTAYLIAEVVVIPLSGWLSKAYSTRWLFVTACAGFTLMSLGCALVDSLATMVTFRLLQGLFGGLMIPLVFAVIYLLFPIRQQARVTLLVGLVVLIAPPIGPVLGGYLTEWLSWRALFLVNLLPGVLICLTVGCCVRDEGPDLESRRHIDIPGIVLLCLFLGSLQYVLEEGAREDWFESRAIARFSLTALVSGVILVWHELRTPHPVIDLRAFRDRNFSVGCLFSFLLGAGLFSIIYLTPLYLSNVKGLNSLQIGQYVMVTGAFEFLSALCAGLLAHRLEPRVMLAIGLAIYGFGCWLNGHLSSAAGYWDFFLPQALRGGALMFCFLPINTLTLGTLPQGAVRNASGLYNLMRNLGGAIGLALSNTVLTQANQTHYANLREHFRADRPAIEHWFAVYEERYAALAAPDSALAALSQLQVLALREVQVLSFNELFQLIGLITSGTVLLTPLLRKSAGSGLARPVARIQR